MDDPDLDREIARIRSRLTSLEAERAELISRPAGLERARQEATSLSPSQLDATVTSVAVTATSPPAQKIELVRRRFAGRPGIVPVRWENARTQRSGYAPACANEWGKGICGKAQVRCGECPTRHFCMIRSPRLHSPPEVPGTPRTSVLRGLHLIMCRLGTGQADQLPFAGTRVVINQ